MKRILEFLHRLVEYFTRPSFRHVRQLEDEINRLEVQLAGCSVAAMGHDLDLEKDDWGWSASFEDVALLRRAFEALAGGRAPASVLADMAGDDEPPASQLPDPATMGPCPCEQLTTEGERTHKFCPVLVEREGEPTTLCPCRCTQCAAAWKLAGEPLVTNDGRVVRS